MQWHRRNFLKVTGGALAARTAAQSGEWLPAEARFHAAAPIWPEGRTREKNLTVAFRCAFDAPAGERVWLRAAASTLYRALLNGGFAGHGPARGPHGWFRIDEWELTPQLRAGANTIVLEVAGYNVNSYYLLDQPSFVQAELVSESGAVLGATGDPRGSFQAALVRERVQKVQRYSFQRPFSEVYRIGAPAEPVKCETVPAVRYLRRRAPYPRFALRQPLAVAAHGRLRVGQAPAKLWKDRSLTGIGPTLGGYPEADLETIPSIEMQSIQTLLDDRTAKPAGAGLKLAYAGLDFDILDFGTNLTGFLGARVTCRRPARVWFVFDEILSRGDVDCKRLGCVNIVACEFPPGAHEFESFEPYTLRYLKVMVLAGECEVQDVYLRELANPESGNAQFACGDERLNRLFAAGRETFRQNALDIFMDCPSRERAGWLCDSFFTARSAFDLCGNTAVETSFFENYLLPESFAHLPAGMLPMCYPADHNDGNFIPNWALWFVLQLEEYRRRSGNARMAEALRPKVMGVLRFFEDFRNGDGLLEKLPGWVFVEWSKANDFVEDVNYPSNMLYAAALAAAGRIYAEPRLLAQAAAVRRAVAAQSFDGEFFVDNAVRERGILRVTRNRTEVCQYFAFYFDVAAPSTHPELWRRLREQFGPKRTAFPDVHPANAFVGNMLRMEILSRYGHARQLLDESLEYLLYMEERTGTLWENISPSASCNHGFASHIVRTLNRDVLGVREIDPAAKTVRLRFADLRLPWCEGTIPTPTGPVRLRWRLRADAIEYRCDVPAGYRVDVENQSGKRLVTA
jgi:alpha-L-rhamnosidase